MRVEPDRLESSFEAADREFGEGALNRPGTACEDAPASQEEDVEEEEEDEKTWIEIQLLNEADQPVPGQAWEITHPDGTTIARGRTNAQGVGRVSGIDEDGTCKICFTELDKDAWEYIDSVSPDEEES